MAIPVLQLNLVPRPTLWRHRHMAIGWTVLALGCVALAGVAGLTVKKYLDARKAGRQAVALTTQATKAARQEANLQDELRAIDSATEQPRWRLAERILSERSLPWSRITAELERSSVQDVRFKSVQRVRPQGSQGVQIKVRLECKSREAEVAFVESVQKNPFFQGVVFERESERQGGGLEVEASLPVVVTPPEYVALPEFGPDRKGMEAKSVQPVAAPKRPAPPTHSAAPKTPAAKVQAVPLPDPDAPDAGPRHPASAERRNAAVPVRPQPDRPNPRRRENP